MLHHCRVVVGSKVHLQTVHPQAHHRSCLAAEVAVRSCYWQQQQQQQRHCHHQCRHLVHTACWRNRQVHRQAPACGCAAFCTTILLLTVLLLLLLWRGVTLLLLSVRTVLLLTVLSVAVAVVPAITSIPSARFECSSIRLQPAAAALSSSITSATCWRALLLLLVWTCSIPSTVT